MIDLELNDPGDTLGDILDRMPDCGQISIGIHGGYVYEGSVKGFFEREPEIDEHMVKINNYTFTRYLRDYRAAIKNEDEEKAERLKGRMVDYINAAREYKRLHDRHIVNAYARGFNDSVLTMILEGHERTNVEPFTG